MTVDASYFDEEYWERGVQTGKSGYDGVRRLAGINQEIAYEYFGKLGLLGKRVLDLGCGPGWFVKYMREQGAFGWGIDISKYAINWGKQNHKPSISQYLVHGSAHDLSFWQDGFFDFIYTNQVLEHIPSTNVLAMARECFRVLKTGGRLWAGLVLAYPPNPQERGPSDPDQTHVTIKYERWWNQKFIRAGFSPCSELIKKIESTNIWQRLKWHHIAYEKPLY